MFLIPTYVAPSHTHGVGVFTPFPLPAGLLIWRFTEGVDMRITAEEIAAVPPALQERLRRYSYRESEDSWVLCMDNARFMNHSPSPNCDDGREEGTVTLRPLEADEELTCDYRVFDIDARARGVDWEEGPSQG